MGEDHTGAAVDEQVQVEGVRELVPQFAVVVALAVVEQGELHGQSAAACAPAHQRDVGELVSVAGVGALHLAFPGVGRAAVGGHGQGVPGSPGGAAAAGKDDEDGQDNENEQAEARTSGANRSGANRAAHEGTTFQHSQHSGTKNNDAMGDGSFRAGLRGERQGRARGRRTTGTAR